MPRHGGVQVLQTCSAQGNKKFLLQEWRVGVYVRPYPTLCPFSYHPPDIFFCFSVFSSPLTTENSSNNRKIKKNKGNFTSYVQDTLEGCKYLTKMSEKYLEKCQATLMFPKSSCKQTWTSFKMLKTKKFRDKSQTQ